MKLNHDCVRECLLFLEENLGLNEYVTIDDLIDSLGNKFSEDDISYSIMKMQEGEYIVGGMMVLPGAIGGTKDLLRPIPIKSITLSGHEYLDNIKDGKVWSKIKSASSSVKGASISVLSAAAKDFMIKTITNSF